ncbi:MAG: esterase-like activity of phytase family protein [Prochlorotrichaceae cyanobacterium]|jgi:hypothetical protein
MRVKDWGRAGQKGSPWGKLLWGGLLSLLLLWGTTGCALVGGSATERVFLDLSLNLLDRYELPPQNFEDTTIGGLSALVYDRQGDQFYALSDDRAHPHFYTLKIPLNLEEPDSPEATAQKLQINAIEPIAVTLLKTTEGEPWPANTLDPEGIALSPQGSLWVSSEGVYATDTPPQILEFDRESGATLRSLPIPPEFAISIDPETRRQQTGVQSNLGLESLTLSPTGSSASAQEPVRLFTLNESPLLQDLDLSMAEEGGRLRLLHYYLAEGPPLLIAEHLYSLETVPLALVNGVSELLALDNNGHFLSLERSLTPFGLKVKLFQIAIAGASDVSKQPALQGALANVKPIQKQLLLDFSTLTIPGSNWEGMSWGPRLPDGSPSLILMSDNNFDSAEMNEFLLFQVNGL